MSTPLQTVDRFASRVPTPRCGLTLQDGSRCRGSSAGEFPRKQGGTVQVCGDCLNEAQGRPTRPAVSGGVGRNDPCPCGSGKKSKRCCR